MNDWGKRCKGCAYCVHADKEKMKCFPESEDCKAEYDLEESDFEKNVIVTSLKKGGIE